VPYYLKGTRNDFVLYLSGWMRKKGVVCESVYKIIEALAVNDEEREARFRTLKETYKKEKLHDIKGYSGFLSLIRDQLHDEEKAHQLLSQVNNLFQSTENRYENNVNCEKIALEEESQKQRLIKLAKANSEIYFKDQYKKTYAKIRLKDHSEIISLDSNKFKHFLSKLYYDYTKGMIVNQESLNDTIRIIEANTIFEGQTIPLNLRIAWGNDTHDSIYYDMTDEKWRCIKITKDGWNIINGGETSTTLFIRYNQNPQVEPDRNYDSDIFDKLLDLTNIKDPKNRLLTKVWIISLLIPDIAHAINITHGEKGSAKTTFCVMIKELVDPDALGLLTTPNDKKEFVQQLSHNHLVVYDNVKSVPHWFSDEICRAVTGIGNSKIRLYSDDEDIIYRYKRCVMVNGINISLTEPDALDRSILTEVARIPNEQRRELSQVMAEFEQIKPELLAYILDTLVKALQIKPTIQLTNLPRMADLAIWGESITRAMGYRPREFINAYYENIGKQNIEALESQPLGQVIPKFCDDYLDDEQLPHKREWEGSPAELLNKLKQTADSCGIDTSQRLWPKSPSALVRRLNTIRSNLLDGLGIKVRIDRITVGDKARKKTSTIRIEKIPPLAPLSPPEQIHAQNQGENGGGISDGGDITSTPKQIPPPENDQNHAQNTESGGSGDSGGIFCNPSVEDKAVFSGYDTATIEQELILNTGKNYLRQISEVTATM
jgi:hypothetical protein